MYDSIINNNNLHIKSYLGQGNLDFLDLGYRILP